MTIKQIGLSAIAAAMVTTSAFAAGTISVTGGQTVSNELLSVQAVDANLTKPIIYTNGMTAASATEPGFELVVPGITANAAGNAHLVVKKDDTNVTVATFDRIDGTTKIIFKKVVGATVIRNVKYRIESDDINGSFNSARGDMIIHLPKASTSATATLTLWNNNGNPSPIDTAPGTLLTTKDQYAMSITTPLSAEIDASNSFKTFENTHTGHGSTSLITDTFTYKLTDLKSDISFPATMTALKLNVVADTNVSSYKITSTTLGAQGGITMTAGTSGDNNITFTDGTVDRNGTNSFAQIFATDQTAAMDKTNWSATAVVTFNGATKKLLDAADAGAWTIYGYNAQIPGASVSTGATDTVVTIVNTQVKGTTAIGAYFTIIDQDGNECKLNSTQGLASVAAVKPGSKNKYRLSAMLGETNCANVSGTAYGIEVSVPTTPTDIYSNAFVENVATTNGRFKVLPVYNNANSY